MDDAVRRAIGGRLREFRLSIKLTQSDMARLLKAERQSVSAWETGKAMPKCEAWYELGVMGMSLDYTVLGIRTVPASSYARGACPAYPRPCVTPPAAEPVP
jgi:DNA-binding XRE family transcriptional regulator